MIVAFLLFNYLLRSLKDKIIKNIKEDLIKNLLANKISILFISAVIWFLVFLDVYFVQLAMNLDLSIFKCILIMLIATIIYAVPSTPGTIGTFHLGIQEFMVLFLNYSTDTSQAFAFILHAHSYLFFIIVGSYYFIKDSKSILSFKGKQ